MILKNLSRYLRYDWPVHFVLLLTNWLPDNFIFMALRGRLVRPFLKSCGSGVTLGRDITFYNPSKIHIGRNVYIAKGCWFLGYDEIHIQAETIFGPYVVVVTANHSYVNGSYHAGPPIDIEPVVIGAGSWIAAHSTILPGAKIERGSLIAANSVFKGSTTPGGIYGGVPARKLKEIELI